VTPLDLLFAVPREGGNDFLIFASQMMVIFAIFYFLLLRPQAKERQRHEEMLKGVKKGDEIVTNGGIIGKVVHVEEGRLTIKTGDNTRLTVDRSGIANVLGGKGAEDGKQDAKA
jgi:preprotein translocase subunit YajC